MCVSIICELLKFVYHSMHVQYVYRPNLDLCGTSRMPVVLLLDKCLHFISDFIARKFIIGMIIRYASLNTIEKIIPKPIFTETRTQDSFRVCDLSSCNLLAETNNFVLCAVLLSCFSFRATETIIGTRSQEFLGLWPLFLNLLFETSNTGLGAVLLSC
jgi:hypothetical protein